MPISNPLLGYENKWVVLTSDRKKVVASAKTIKALEKKLKGIKKEEVILHWVEAFDRYYSY